MLPPMTGASPQPPAAMDPARAQGIVARMATLDFAWDIERALEFALFRTYAVPRISGLLARTGEFETRPRKRYDDTELILSEIVETGPDSPRGAAALARMNAMHGRYRIRPADMAYVLSTFVLEPIRWLDRFGRRPMTDEERQATFVFWTDVGRRMGIADLPPTLAAMDAANRAFEAAEFRYADTNARIARATTDLMLGFYLPRPLWPLGRPAMRALMDPPLLRAMRLAPAPRWLVRAVTAGLALRARVLAWLPPRRRPYLQTARSRPTYPDGYEIRDLGTF